MFTEKKQPTKVRNGLIPFVETNDDLLIDARLLHQRLNSKQQYADWIKKRIQEFGFIENQDFFINLRKSVFGRPKKEYHLTLDMAKELAMVERTPTGRMIRQYFIQVEKEYRYKRLYGQSHTLTQVRKSCRSINFMGRNLYHYRDVQRVLGYSTRSSSSHVKRRFAGQIALINGTNYVSEEYVKLMITRATARQQANITKKAKPVSLPEGFNQPLLFEL